MTGRLLFVENDGGRLDAGFKGRTGDCVTRAVAIASGLPYADIYAAFAAGTGGQRSTSRTPKRARSARNGVNTNRKWFIDWMIDAGFVWTPTMRVGSGCLVHLARGELPAGRLVVSLSRHYTAVIDGVIHDAFDPSRATIIQEDGVQRIAMRCVYGYWTKT